MLRAFCGGCCRCCSLLNKPDWEERKRGILRSVDIFNELPRRAFMQMCEKVELVVANPGEKIIAEGEKADCFYIIRHGHLRVTKGHELLTHLSRPS